ncbi:MAG: MerR family transcriptional regulator [Planctomycetota bacterium]
METKAIELSRRLQADLGGLVDYRGLAARCAELGFRTTVRTLRFYVNEGLLGAPSLHGRVAMFPERETLHLLLVIHVLKTRFKSSLAAIRELVRQQSSELDVLAERCLELHAEANRTERWQRVERDWLLSAYLRTLRGDLTLYPRSRRGESGLRSPREVELAELYEDLRAHSSWRREPDASWRWVAPDEQLSHS